MKRRALAGSVGSLTQLQFAHNAADVPMPMKRLHRMLVALFGERAVIVLQTSDPRVRSERHLNERTPALLFTAVRYERTAIPVGMFGLPDEPVPFLDAVQARERGLRFHMEAAVVHLNSGIGLVYEAERAAEGLFGELAYTRVVEPTGLRIVRAGEAAQQPYVSEIGLCPLDDVAKVVLWQGQGSTAREAVIAAKQVMRAAVHAAFDVLEPPQSTGQAEADR